MTVKAPSDRAIRAAMKEAAKAGLSEKERWVWFETVRSMLNDWKLAQSYEILESIKSIGNGAAAEKK